MAVLLNYWMLASRRLLLGGLVPILLGALLGLQGWLLARDASIFVENLRETEGKVINLAPVDGDIRIDVDYLDETGVRFHKQFTVGSQQEPLLRQVGKVSVVYDLRSPQIAELGHIVSANNERLLYWGVAVAGALLFLIGAWVVGREFHAAVACIGLLSNGQITQTEVRDSTLAPGRSAGRFTYAFRGPDGRWYEGKSPELPATQLAAWPVGRRIFVAYDPINPRRTEADVFGVIPANRRDAIQPA
ncbi:MAG: hypothetical protein JNM66_31745 [Bryobacterales bacterium]|nr:hypothetical protein [Bryobacterales bacterium]